VQFVELKNTKKNNEKMKRTGRNATCSKFNKFIISSLTTDSWGVCAILCCSAIKAKYTKKKLLT